MKVLCLLVMIFMPTITCYGQQHYENCDIIKKQDYDITVAVIEYMPEPFDETLAPKDYMLSNLNRLKEFIIGVATEVEIVVFPEYALTSTEVLTSNVVPR